MYARNKIEEGANQVNTDMTRDPSKEAKVDALKPMQHPKNIYSDDSGIVSYKVPPKNLTPYYQIPDQALAELDLPCKESPQGSKALDVCLLGATNAGKSSILNHIVQRHVSAVSDKSNTTDEAIMGVYTDIEKRTQLSLYDTPGVTKGNDSMRSNLLVSRAWDTIDECDMVLFVVDSVKRLSFEMKQALIRLEKKHVDPQDLKILDAMRDESFSEDKFADGEYLMTDQEKHLSSFHMPSVLVMNKIDLVSSKRKLKTLQNELEDLGSFEQTFHISAETGFGLDQLVQYMVSRAKPREWEYDPRVVSKQSEVDKAEEAMKQALMEKLFHELPYQVGVKVTAWVPKLNGELRIDYQLDVKHKTQIGMLLGEKGRIIKEIKLRTNEILMQNIQRPVSIFIEVVKRRNDISGSNTYDQLDKTAIQ